MDRKTLPINTRDLNTIHSLGTKQEQEIHAQTKQIQKTGDVERLEGLQDRDSADPIDPADPTDPSGKADSRDKGKGKAAPTVPWTVLKTVKGVEEVYQDDLAFIANLPNTPDQKEQMLRRLDRWADAQRAVCQDIGNQVKRDHELAQNPQQREYDTESQSQGQKPGHFPDSWDSVVTDPGIEDENENPEYMMSGALPTATDQDMEGDDE
jgi:hypothetical protein